MPFVTEELWQRLPGRGTMGEQSMLVVSCATREEGGALRRMGNPVLCTEASLMSRALLDC